MKKHQLSKLLGAQKLQN